MTYAAENIRFSQLVQPLIQRGALREEWATAKHKAGAGAGASGPSSAAGAPPSPGAPPISMALETGERIAVSKAQSRGTYGKFHLSRLPDNQLAAAKVLRLHDEARRAQDQRSQRVRSTCYSTAAQAFGEVAAAFQAGSPLAPSLVVHWRNKVYLFGLLMDGDLMKIPLQLRRNGGAVVSFVALHIVRQLAELHRGRSMVHGDVKPTNVVWSRDGHVWFCDFGFAQPLDPNTGAGRQRVLPPLSYSAPELLAGSCPSPASDAWAAGITLWYWVVGDHPGAVDEWAVCHAARVRGEGSVGALAAAYCQQAVDYAAWSRDRQNRYPLADGAKSWPAGPAGLGGGIDLLRWYARSGGRGDNDAAEPPLWKHFDQLCESLFRRSPVLADVVVNCLCHVWPGRRLAMERAAAKLAAELDASPAARQAPRVALATVAETSCCRWRAAAQLAPAAEETASSSAPGR